METSGITSTTPSQLERQNRIRQVAQEFESMFNSMMLRAMRKTVGENPLFPQSFGEKVYTEMLDDKYASLMSSTSSSGLASLIMKELGQNEDLSGDDLQGLLGNNSSQMSSWMIDNRFIPSSGSMTTGSSYDSSKPLVERVKKWDSYIEKASELYGVDKNLISAVIAAESGGNQYAISHAGAKGLMQLMDSTAKDMGVSQSFSPWANIRGGVGYLRMMLDRQNGNEELALASYNAGPSAVDKYNGIPPYAETQNYVKTVLRLKDTFAKGE